MIVEVLEIERPLEISHVYGSEELGFEHNDARLEESVALEAVLTRKRGDVRIRGALRTALNFTCSRCLREFRVPIDQSFDLSYEPLSQAPRSDEEIELKYEDMNIAFYRDGIIDVDWLVREQLVLAVPLKPVCSENCRGLCEICGTDLNLESCRCARSQLDPRLAALIDLKRRLEG